MSATAVTWGTGWDAGWDGTRDAGRGARRPVASVRSLRLTRRGRAAVTLVAVALASGAVLSAQAAAADAPGDALPIAAHTVVAGETLWEIAGTVTVAGQDRRDVVDRLVELNGLAGSTLQAGQQIIVPVP